jgi:NADPH:quinone reductase-like Zn-dependent oxidoreductase
LYHPINKSPDLRCQILTADDEKLSRAKKFISEGMASGQFKAKVAKVFPFEQIVEATQFLESNAQFGKIIVTID